MYATSDSYLAHHGIKGQRWGVRRYQNSDGSYTSAGKQKRNNSKQVAKKIAKGAAITAGILAAGYAANIASEEIQSSKNYKAAKQLTADIMRSNFKDLTVPQRDIVSSTITKHNSALADKQITYRKRARKAAAKDAFNAYINPKTASTEARNQFRQTARSGGYSVKQNNFDDFGMINTSNIGKYEKGLRRTAGT